METLAFPYPPWLDLPDPLLEIILECLPLSDYVRFPAVCRRWRSVQTSHRRRHSPSPPPMLRLPWFRLCQPHNDTITCYSPFEDKFFTIPLPSSPLHPMSIGHGWFLQFSDDSGCNPNLLNPISGAKIQLPPVPTNSNLRLLAFRVAFSPPPNYVVFAIDFSYIDSIFLVRWFDSGWVELKFPSVLNPVHDALSISGKNYFILSKCFPSVPELNSIDLLVVDPLTSPPTFQYFQMSKETRCKYRRIYLVEFDEEPLLIKEHFKYEKNNCRETTRFELFRVDLGRRMWVKVESIGDRVLVFYEGRSVSLLAADIGARGNCIYFPSGSCYYWRVFDLGTWVMTDVPFPDNTLQIENCFKELFMPSLC